MSSNTDINAGIVDQRVIGIINRHSELLPKGDDTNLKKSVAFMLLCISTYLDLPIEESAEFLTDGGNDAGVDGLQVGEVEDNEFLITLFQAKYKVEDLSGGANFPENSLQRVVATIDVLFDPYRRIQLNPKLAPKIEEIRSLIRDGYIPKVNVVLCNNGKKWTEQANDLIKEAKAEFYHFNHDTIVGILQSSKIVDATLMFSGKMIEENLNYMRVLVGRVAVQEIKQLLDEYGDKILDRNIRRYLGLRDNRVNTAMRDTLSDPQESDRFYPYNNGVTVVCDKFEYNAFQQSDFRVHLKNMQIINGGQTCKTIQQTLKDSPLSEVGRHAYVMVRVYQLSDEDKNFVKNITHATNSQNPVDLRDLRSNDKIQKQLELGIAELNLDYTYKRHREAGESGPMVITSPVVAEAVLAIWKERPPQAKFRRSVHFDLLYDYIFSKLNAAQALVAVLIFREVENERKRPTIQEPPDFLPYASHYIAMLVGRSLLREQDIGYKEINHRNVKAILNTFNNNKKQYYHDAIKSIEDALGNLYGFRNISLQQLSATFRRGDLIEILNGKT